MDKTENQNFRRVQPIRAAKSSVLKKFEERSKRNRVKRREKIIKMSEEQLRSQIAELQAKYDEDSRKHKEEMEKMKQLLSKNNEDDSENEEENLELKTLENRFKEKKKLMNQKKIEDLRQKIAEMELDVELDDAPPTRRIDKVSFRDTVDTIPKFKGDDPLYTVGNWIRAVEDSKNIYGWNELETFVAAKKALKGVAKTWFENQEKITSWEIMKNEIEEEFYKETSASAIHSKMAARRRKKDESTESYIQEMRSLGRLGNLSDKDIIQYIKDGVFEDTQARLALSGITKYKDLKDRIEDCQKTLRRTKEDHFRKKKSSDDGKDGKDKKDEKRTYCFNCGDSKHISKDCPDKDKGPKCFNCDSFGHKSNECKNEKKEKKNKDSKKSEKKNTT